jgi:hypothetical protein
MPRRSILSATERENLLAVPDAKDDLTGDDLWRSSAKVGAGKFRPLRPLQPA